MTSDGKSVVISRICRKSAAIKPPELMIVSGLLPHGSEDENDTMKDHIDAIVSKVASLKCKATISSISPASSEKARQLYASLNLHMSAKCKTLRSHSSITTGTSCFATEV